MSKRKRSTSKESASGTPSEGEPSVHVSPDVLAGSPDVFAPSKDKPAETPEPAAMSADSAPAETAAAEEAPPAAAEEPAAKPEEPAPAVAATVVEAPPAPHIWGPRAPGAGSGFGAQPSRRVGSSVALGVVLVVLGLFALIIQFTGFDAGGSWPLFVVIPGLTLLLVGFISLGTGALIPGAILTVIGLILSYMNATQDWPAWAFAWPLVAPGGVGLGIWLQGLRNSDAHLLRQGRVLMFVALIIFMIGFVIFGTIFRISEMDYGWFGKAALPALLIVIGVILLARSIQRSRET